MQQLEGLDSLGSGQVFGIGLFAENHNYVPEMYNDFIFTFIGESFGFVWPWSRPSPSSVGGCSGPGR